jgi:hypothetical protein
MNFRSKLVAVAGSALILASSLTFGVASAADNDTATASVKVTTNASNVLSVVIENGSFGSVVYDFADQDTKGTLDVTVTDLRGTAPGWNVNLSASDFATGDASPKTFGIGNLSLAPGAASATTKFSTTNGITPSGAIQVSSAPQPILTASAGSGDGEFTSTLAGTLKVPGGTLVGDYAAEVTVSIDAAP